MLFVNVVVSVDILKGNQLIDGFDGNVHRSINYNGLYLCMPDARTFMYIPT